MGELTSTEAAEAVRTNEKSRKISNFQGEKYNLE